MARRRQKRLTITRKAGPEPMLPSDVRAVEAILASLVARAYAADHPELFGPHLARISGGPADARQ